MKTTFFLLLAFLFIAYTGSPKINFSPFSISFEKPYLPFATLFLMLAIVCYSIQYQNIGYKKGVDDTVKIVENIVKSNEEKE